MPPEMQEDIATPEYDYNLFFKCGIEYWRSLFPSVVYSSIAIESSVIDVMEYSREEICKKEVLFITEDSGMDDGNDSGCEKKEFPNVTVHGCEFEARVILSTTTRVQNVNSSNDYIGVRYVRHGAGFSSWWKQERTRNAPIFMTQCDVRNVSDDISSDNHLYFVLYVKCEQKRAIDFKLDFHRLLGGQVKVFCRCNNGPLIITGYHPENKRNCMIDACTRKEYCVCSHNLCNTRICKKHFDDDLKKHENTFYNPPINPTPNATHQGETNDAVADSLDDEENDGEKGSDMIPLRERIRLRQHHNGDDLFDETIDHMDAHEDEFFMGDFLTNTNYNPLDEQEENHAESLPNIPATNAGDFPYTHLHKSSARAVPCHVLFNQAGVLCTRYNKRINGTNMQRNFLQRIVSTTAGTSMPLLYMMATCFPRHFYASAKFDHSAALGSPPLACL